MATNTKVLERGDCYFFYQPKREEESAGGLEDVQRFNAILAPKDNARYRL